MGKSVNQVNLMGRLTRDVEVKMTPSGKKVASLTLAVDKYGEGTNFVDVTAWEKTADVLEQYTKKGSKVFVAGRLDQQTWEDKESGKNRSKIVVIATDVTLLDSKEQSDSQTDTPNAPGTGSDDKPVDLSEIPF